MASLASEFGSIWPDLGVSEANGTGSSRSSVLLGSSLLAAILRYDRELFCPSRFYRGVFQSLASGTTAPGRIRLSGRVMKVWLLSCEVVCVFVTEVYATVGWPRASSV
ncbi:unnamed protein product [Microthlaspi erraticum]|uniref:Uncharacterized protein n=1 Tax=Microthlaspi erraticum TaxID=1685480 RepID=A0A6D2J428_9BRAS|nr:unnamed protein product [Microthlaspi erraticum]